jgi:hypothetical protein
MQLIDKRLIGNEGTCNIEDKDILGLHTTVPKPVIYCVDPSTSFTVSIFELWKYFKKSLEDPAMWRDAPQLVNHGASLQLCLEELGILPQISAEAVSALYNYLSPHSIPLNCFHFSSSTAVISTCIIFDASSIVAETFALPAGLVPWPRPPPPWP